MATQMAASFPPVVSCRPSTAVRCPAAAARICLMVDSFVYTSRYWGSGGLRNRITSFNPLQQALRTTSAAAVAASAAAAAVSVAAESAGAAQLSWGDVCAVVSCSNCVASRQFLQRQDLQQRMPQQCLQQKQHPGQQQQRRFAKIVRWDPDTPLVYGLETFREAEDFFKACEQHKGKMKRRDWMAALSLVSTRRRLDFRSPSFRAFVAAALQQQELLQAPHIHLTIHRLGVVGYGPALWQLALHLQPLLQQQQLSSKQLAVCAWGMAKNVVTSPPLWDLIGAEALRLARGLCLTDLSMILWAFARVERLKPSEILVLKEEVLNRLGTFVRKTLAAAATPDLGAAAAVATAATAAAAAPPAAAQLTQRHEDGSQRLGVTTHAKAITSELGDAAGAAVAVTAHDLCMLIRSFADLTPGDSALIIRLLYTLLLVCRVPASVQAAAAAAADTASAATGEEGQLREVEASAAFGASAPLTAQGLTAVWTALKDAKITEVFSLPQHKRPCSSSSSSSSSRHRAYLPFRETVPLDCLPLLLPILKPAQVFPRVDPQAALSETMPPATRVEARAAPQGVATDVPHATRIEAVGPTTARALDSAGTEPHPYAVAASSTPAATAAAVEEGLRSNALLHSACTDVLLEVLCEETRALRLDHTTNTSMVASLAEALADMQLVDPRLVYQLVLFAHQRGAAQFQGEQLLKVLEAFEGCQIADSKAWARLAHRAQDVVADLDLKGLKRLRQLARRSGYSNARLEGVFDHFEALKEGVQRCGPL